METLNIIKRKKKKTRRCLDELRKRTQQPNNVCNISNKNAVDKVHKKSSCSLISCNYITNNRLTLLNKTVRSETVTRLQLPVLRSKNFNQINRGKISSVFNRDIIPYKTAQDVNTVFEKYSDTLTEEDMSGIDVSPDIHIHKGSNKSPKSIMLFSPDIHDDDKAMNTILDSSIEISILSSTSSPNSNTKSNSFWYNYFMDSLEHYVEQTFPELIKYNYAEKYRATLLEKYIKNRCTEPKEYNDIKQETDHISRKGPEVNIIQNPKDYLSYSWNYLPYTETCEVGVSSPTTSNSSESISIPSSSPILTLVCDTPEYSYYPHRLN